MDGTSLKPKNSVFECLKLQCLIQLRRWSHAVWSSDHRTSQGLHIAESNGSKGFCCLDAFFEKSFPNYQQVRYDTRNLFPLLGWHFIQVVAAHDDMTFDEISQDWNTNDLGLQLKVERSKPKPTESLIWQITLIDYVLYIYMWKIRSIPGFNHPNIGFSCRVSFKPIQRFHGCLASHIPVIQVCWLSKAV